MDFIKPASSSAFRTRTELCIVLIIYIQGNVYPASLQIQECTYIL